MTHELTLCGCGCGRPTTVARKTDRRSGHIKGQPVPFLPSHRLLPSTIERFRSKIEVDTVSGCWNWMAYRGRGGYGQFHVNRHPVAAHRWSYEYHVGPIPDGLEIDHLCRNRACVNPDHLEAVTRQVNQRRSLSVSGINAAKTHCIKGHPLTGDNVRMASGYRVCRTCERARPPRKRRRRP